MEEQVSCFILGVSCSEAFLKYAFGFVFCLSFFKKTVERCCSYNNKAASYYSFVELRYWLLNIKCIEGSLPRNLCFLVCPYAINSFAFLT